jgi:serine/threonine protein kinase
MPHKLVSQDSFACIYTPEIRCRDKAHVNGQKKLASKITAVNNTREIEIGVYIQTIPHYYSFFAPIIHSCPVDIGLLADEEIRACSLFRDNKQYISNNMRFLGNTNIRTALVGAPLSKTLEYSIHIVKALSLLADMDDPIIQFNISSRNVMFDHTYSVPIITDFSVASKKSQLAIPEYSLQHWPLEVFLLTSMHKADKRDPVDVDSLKTVAKSFVANMARKFSAEELRIFESESLATIDTFAPKTWDETVGALTANCLSWDNYSAAVMFNEIAGATDPSPHAATFRTCLAKIILSTSNTRLTPSETLPLLTSIGVSESSSWF